MHSDFGHGILSDHRILYEGDRIHIDVSAALKGYWRDNGNSFLGGEDPHERQKLVGASKAILY